MSLFGNQNFINQVAKEIGLPHLDEDVAALLQTLVEVQTRKFIHQASKFATSDLRDEIAFEDFQNALVDLRHSEFVLIEQEEDYIRDGSFYIRRDPTYKSAKNFIEEELKILSLNSFSLPKLQGRWIYIDGRIPRINKNAPLKCKSEIISIRQKEKGEKNKQFNIIMDQPEAMLTGFELDYFKQVTNLLSEGNDSISKLNNLEISGNLSNLLPLFLKFFISSDMTDIKMSYLLELLSNKYVEYSAEHHLHQIFTILWSYEGKLCFNVGMRIGKYLQKFQHKYYTLRQNWTVINEDFTDNEIHCSQEIRNTSYSSMIKRIGIEIVTGNTFKLNEVLLSKIDEDCQEKNELAMLCRECIQEYSPRIQCLQQRNLAFWLPNAALMEGNCAYMMMGL